MCGVAAVVHTSVPLPLLGGEIESEIHLGNLVKKHDSKKYLNANMQKNQSLMVAAAQFCDSWAKNEGMGWN